MTYSEAINQSLIKFPTEANDALRSVIFDWFQFRELVDTPDKFNAYFGRVLKRDIPQYNELLRLEPGAKDWAWLINNTLDSKDDTTNTNNYTDNRSGSLKDIGTDDFSSNRSLTTNNIVTNTAAMTGNVTSNGTDTHTGNNQDTSNGTEDTTTDLTSKNTETPDQTVKVSYGHVLDITNNGTVNNSSESTDTQNDSSTADTKTMNKVAPQSISYSNGGSGGKLPALDWRYATGQNQGETTTSGNTTKNSTSSSNDITSNTGKSTDSGADTTKTTGTNVTDQVDKTIVDRDTTSSTQHTINEELKKVNNEDTTQNSNSTETGKLDTTESTTNDRDTTLNRSTTDNLTHDQSETGNNIHTHKGQSEATSKLLEDAADWIKRSSAWAWMQVRLEPCFLGVYNI